MLQITQPTKPPPIAMPTSVLSVNLLLLLDQFVSGQRLDAQRTPSQLPIRQSGDTAWIASVIAWGGHPPILHGFDRGPPDRIVMEAELIEMLTPV